MTMEFDGKVSVEKQGRSGHVDVAIAGDCMRFGWEFGGGSCIAMVDAPDPDRWLTLEPHKAYEREALLAWLATEIARRECPGATIEIGRTGIHFFESSPGRAGTSPGESPMRFVDCSFASHADQILEILNEAIVTSTALYDYRPRPPESMVGWFAAKAAGRFPVIGAVDADGRLLGFASYGTFRAWPAYKYTVEHSVYVHADHRGRGIGLALMQRLVAAARQQQHHVMVGAIDMANAKSIAMHERLGFTHAGTIRQAAFKFGRWLDLGFWQLILETPADPVDG